MTFAKTLRAVASIVYSAFLRRFALLSAMLISFAAIPATTAFAQIIFGNGSESMIFTISGTITSESANDWGTNTGYSTSPHYPPVVGQQFSIVLNTKDYNHDLYWMTLHGEGLQGNRLDVTPQGFSVYLKELEGPPDYWFRLDLLTTDLSFNARTVGLTEYSGSYFDATNSGIFFDSGHPPDHGGPSIPQRIIDFHVDNLSVFYVDPLLLPTITTSAGVTRFTEKLISTPVAVDSLLTVILGVPTAPSATVSITTNFFPAEDVLEFANDGTTMGNIAGTYDITTGKLTLASSGGTATIAQWQAALRAVAYLNASPLPTPINRTISFIINDGTVDSVPSTKIVSVEPIDNPPTDVTLSSSTVYRAEGINATVGTLHTVDLDSASFTYSLVSGSGSTDNSRFNIQGSLLRANDAGALVPGAYSVRLKTDDGSGGTFSKALAITVAEQRPAGVTSVAAGQNFTLFVKSDGTLWGMGSNTKGQLGDGTVTSRGSPIQLATNVAMAAAGSEHSLFVKNDGTLWAMGSNSFGQLGDGTTTERHVPVEVASGVVLVAAGSDHSLFLKIDGTLWGMGSNSNGALDGTFTDRLTPVQVADHVVSIAAGGAQSAFVRTDGSLWIPAPRAPVLLATQVAGVAQGFTHTMFIKLDGTLWGWGSNMKGELGDGTLQNRSVPVQVPGVTGVKTVTAGWEYTVFVETDGTMWGMGWNTFGVLGDGTFNDRIIPVQVREGVATASAASGHMMFTTIDGALWGVGESSDGQLGDGMEHGLRAVPVLVLDGPLITTQPLSQTKVTGSSVTFTVTASGTPNPTFQWKKDGSAIMGATSGTLTLANIQVSDAGNYTLEATNLGGSATSRTATLTVNPATAAPIITTQPLSQVIVSGNSVTFTVAASGVPLPTFQWLKNGVAIDGATGATLTIGEAVAGDAGSYTAIATNSAGSVTSEAAILTIDPIAAAPVITTQPSSLTVNSGYAAVFSITVTGFPLPTFQWQKNGVNIDGATGISYSLASVGNSDVGSYRVIATNSAGSSTSDPAVLVVMPRSLVTINAGSDFNGDGKSDLLWQNTSTGERSIWLMNGTKLTAGVSLGLSPTQWSIAAVADFNGDGKVDLVWQNTLTGERTIWLMNGTTFSSSVSLGTYSTDLRIAGAGDFNGDGKPDLVWQNTSTGARSIWLMNGTTVSSTIDLGTLPPEWSIAGAADFNGDGKCDLIWQNTVTGERAIWLMNGTTVTAGVTLGVYPQLQIAGTGDYNGDGKTDILWTNVNTGERIIWLMNGTTKASEVSLGVVSLDWVLNRPVFRRALADFNNDGKSDLVWQNTSTGERAIWIMNGTEARTGLSLGNYPLDQWIAAVGDFNNDGKADLVWENRTTGARSIALMNGTTILSTVALGTYGTEWKINTTGDFNADGKPDLVWTNTSTGARAIWLMDGTSFIGGADLGIVPVAQQIAGTGDFNGDGQTDILWQNATTGERTIWLMNGTTHTSTITLGTYAPEWSIVGTGDYNSDGKPDLLWQNTTTGERAIWLMNGTTFISSAAVGTYDTNWTIRN